MALFKDLQNRVYAYEDDVDPKYILPDLVAVTAEEAETLRLASLPPAPPVILTCTPWQIRKALNSLPGSVTTLRDDVEAYVAAADQTTKDGWEFATEFREDDAFVAAAQAALGMTDADRTNLFNLARSL